MHLRPHLALPWPRYGGPSNDKGALARPGGPQVLLLQQQLLLLAVGELGEVQGGNRAAAGVSCRSSDGGPRLLVRPPGCRVL